MSTINGNFLFPGAEGLEPPNNGIKTRRLTTWLCPNLYSIMERKRKKVNWADENATLGSGLPLSRVNYFFYLKTVNHRGTASALRLAKVVRTEEQVPPYMTKARSVSVSVMAQKMSASSLSTWVSPIKEFTHALYYSSQRCVLYAH